MTQFRKRHSDGQAFPVKQNMSLGNFMDLAAGNEARTELRAFDRFCQVDG